MIKTNTSIGFGFALTVSLKRAERNERPKTLPGSTLSSVFVKDFGSCIRRLKTGRGGSTCHSTHYGGQTLNGFLTHPILNSLKC